MTLDPSSSSPAPTTTPPTISTTKARTQSLGPTLAELQDRAAEQRAQQGRDRGGWMEVLFPLIAGGSAPVGLFILWLRSDPMPAGETNWWPIGMLGLLLLWLLARVIRGSR